jgi:hypothetical protein
MSTETYWALLITLIAIGVGAVLGWGFNEIGQYYRYRGE